METKTIEFEIRDGYVLLKGSKMNVLRDKMVYTLVFEKEQKHKTFYSYIDEYLTSEEKASHDSLAIWLDRISRMDLVGFLKEGKFEYVPIEIKLGILSFICNDNNTTVSKVLYPDLINGSSSDWDSCVEVGVICPIGFLNIIRSQQTFF